MIVTDSINFNIFVRCKRNFGLFKQVVKKYVAIYWNPPLQAGCYQSQPTERCAADKDDATADLAAMNHPLN